MLHLSPVGFFNAGGIPEIPTTSLVSHFLSDTGVTESGGLVSAWADQIGSRNLSEGTNMPSLVTDQIDGYPSIRFDGVNDKLQDSSGNLAQPVHVFMVVNQISWVNSRTIFGERTDVFNPELRQSATTPNIRVASVGAEIAASIGTWHLVGVYFNGSSSYTAVDGTESAVAGNVTAAFSGGISLGCRGSTSFSNVEFAEIAIYSSERTGSDLSDIETYFAAKYGSLSIA